jgi:ribonuclease E
VTQADARGNSGEPRGERRDRPERGERQERGERRERGARQEGSERQERGERPERAGRQEGSERQERGERPERAGRQEGSERQDRGDGHEGGEGRGRRRRGRRERGARPEGESTATEAPGTQAGLGAAAMAGSASAELQREHFETPPQDVQSAGGPARTWEDPVAVEAPAAEQATLAPVAPPAADVVVPHRHSEPVASSDSLPTEREATAPPVYRPESPPYRAPALAQAYAMPQDLVQVETAHVAPPPEVQGHLEELPRRARRPRAVDAVAEGEPLVQIETRSATSGTD